MILKNVKLSSRTVIIQFGSFQLFHIFSIYTAIAVFCRFSFSRWLRCQLFVILGSLLLAIVCWAWLRMIHRFQWFGDFDRKHIFHGIQMLVCSPPFFGTGMEPVQRYDVDSGVLWCAIYFFGVWSACDDVSGGIVWSRWNKVHLDRPTKRCGSSPRPDCLWGFRTHTNSWKNNVDSFQDILAHKRNDCFQILNTSWSRISVASFVEYRVYALEDVLEVDQVAVRIIPLNHFLIVLYSSWCFWVRVGFLVDFGFQHRHSHDSCPPFRFAHPGFSSRFVGTRGRVDICRAVEVCVWFDGDEIGRPVPYIGSVIDHGDHVIATREQTPVSRTKQIFITFMLLGTEFLNYTSAVFTQPNVVAVSLCSLIIYFLTFCHIYVNLVGFVPSRVIGGAAFNYIWPMQTFSYFRSA